ncbi:hypothetical protein GOP47_0008598 [Adiantum capillus-veneris]|uniref:Uncharacterized protein n=1 Tax=Adiantum capillus-veneris TaxID=13818 RepID=A0A9D4UZM2_ADICA|nr:hypothetical protein GOP47_0008598 [Adiantum capillus-veneris]
MKLFSWAQNKLLPYNHGSNKHVQPNTGRLSDIRRQFLASDNQSGHSQAKANNETPVYSEVLTIGTLGMGNLLNFSREKEEEEEEEETEDEQDSDVENDDEVAHYISPIVDPLSPTRESMSSNRESLSSNRESVSSMDIQKLQEELQKILYFKIGQAARDQARPSASKGSSTACNGSRVKEARKGKARREGNEGYGKESGKKNMRELMPLHNFLEMPMDTILSKSKSKSKGGGGEQGLYKLLTKRHYWLLMQSLKSRLLHSTHITIPPPLFESLVHKSSSKAFHLLQKLKKRVPNGWTNWNGKAEANNERPHIIHVNLKKLPTCNNWFPLLPFSQMKVGSTQMMTIWCLNYEQKSYFHPQKATF